MTSTDNTSEDAKEYDVALSFAGEDRSYAERLAEILQDNGRTVFYDKYEQATLWGKDLYQHLARIYSEQARYCVVFISEHYRDKLWTKHEQRMAQERAFSQKSEYVLPVRLDDTDVPGIPRTVAYLDLRSNQIEDIARLLLQKLEDTSPLSQRDILQTTSTAVPQDAGTAGHDSTVADLDVLKGMPTPSTADGPNEQRASETTTIAPRRRRNLISVAVVVVAVVVLVSVTIILSSTLAHGTSPAPTDGSKPPSSQVAVSPAEPAPCSEHANGTTFVQPQVSSAGTQSGLTFCPIQINNGKLPITGRSFDLAGQILGRADIRQQVLLVNHDDPQTCDALGNPAVRGDFLISRADIGSTDGRWSYTDGLGYDEAITYARNYSYITGPPAALSAIKNDRQNWDNGHPGQAGDYPGIASFPPDTQILATFNVPAGKYPGSRPCKTA